MSSQLDELSRGADGGWPGLTGLPQGPPTIAPWLGVGGDEPTVVEGPAVAEPAPAAVPPPTYPAYPTGPEPPARRRGQYALLGGLVVLLLVAALVAGLTVHRDDAARPPSTVAPSTTPSTVTPPSSSTPPSTTRSPSAPNNNATPGRPTRPGTAPSQNGQSSQNGRTAPSQNGQSSPSPSSPSTTVPGGQASPGLPATGTRVFLGVEVSTGSSGGAQVETVETGTPAATAGLKGGDVIVALDGTQVGTADDLVAALQAHAPGNKVTLTVDDSSGAERTVPVTLGSR